jgi:drug/metabolite transporter (DMT)-like permease
MIWMVASAAFLAVGNSVVRKIALELHPFQIGFLVNLVVLAVVWPALRRPVSAETRATRRKLYAITAAIGGITNLAWFYALAHVPLAEATAITFAAPILVIALAGLVLGEKVSPAHWAAVVVGFLGVTLIVRPGFAEVDLGVVAVLLSTCGMASTYLLSKRITAVDSTQRAAAMMTAIPVITGLVPALLVWKQPGLTTILWVILMAAAMYCGRLAMLNAFRNAPASTVMPFDFARLPFIAIIAYAAYGEVPDSFALAGGVIVIAASGAVFEMERRRERRILA